MEPRGGKTLFNPRTAQTLMWNIPALTPVAVKPSIPATKPFATGRGSITPNTRVIMRQRCAITVLKELFCNLAQGRTEHFRDLPKFLALVQALTTCGHSVWNRWEAASPTALRISNSIFLRRRSQPSSLGGMSAFGVALIVDESDRDREMVHQPPWRAVSCKFSAALTH